MKTISILVPTYNEEVNIPLIYERIRKVFESSLSNYNFELIYIDNYSIDKSREIIEDLSKMDSRVKAIFNAILGLAGHAFMDYYREQGIVQY